MILAGIYSLGAGNRGLIRALGAADGERALSVIAHELTENTANALRKGCSMPCSIRMPATRCAAPSAC